MRVLVTGAYGFIGRHVVQALCARGHAVVAAVRAQRRGHHFPGIDTVDCDFARDVEPQAWRARLDGIDAIVNCAGILRPRDGATFDAAHRAAPLALAQAAHAAGVARFVQISALGNPADGEFIASKHRGDAQLLALELPVTVLRPSLVYALAGSYGGTSLLRALAAAPFVLPLPGDGAQRVQPIHAEDLAALVVEALERPQPLRGVYEIAGPQALSLRDYLEGLRAWLGVRRGRVLRVPRAAMNLAATLGDAFGTGPLGRTLWRMTQRGNALSEQAVKRQRETFATPVRAYADALASTPSHTQDRWHARLYPLAPVLRVALAAVCLVSAVAGFALTPDALQALARPLGLSETAALAFGYGGSAVDAVLGTLLLVPRTARAAARVLLVLALGYTVVFGVALPALWLDPFGGLVKNLVLIPAVWVYLVLAEPR